jgi:hypothetical protein
LTLVGKPTYGDHRRAMDSEPHEKRQSPIRIGFRLLRNAILFVAIIVGDIFVGVVVVQAIHNQHSRSSSSSIDRVTSEAAADHCDNSGYYEESQITGAKQTIYDCSINGKMKCVTENGGIASDSTEEVRLLFQSALGARKPSCLG